MSTSALSIDEGAALVHTGKRLQYFTIVWNSLEAFVAVVSGLIAGSISLVGFGLTASLKSPPVRPSFGACI
jgi:hypothetical protein